MTPRKEFLKKDSAKTDAQHGPKSRELSNKSQYAGSKNLMKQHKHHSSAVLSKAEEDSKVGL